MPNAAETNDERVIDVEVYEIFVAPRVSVDHIEVDFVISPSDEHLNAMFDLRKTIDAHLAKIDVFSSNNHHQGLAQHALSDVQRKLASIIESYSQKNPKES